MTPRIHISTAEEIHLGVVVGKDVLDANAMTVLGNVLNYVNGTGKLALVSTLRTRQGMSAASAVYQLDKPTLMLSVYTDLDWWLRTVNMLCVIDNETQDDLLDRTFDAFNAGCDDGYITYPFLHCRKSNNYAVEVL